LAAAKQAAAGEAAAKARAEAKAAEEAEAKAAADAAASFAAAREEAKAAEARRQRDFMQSFVRRQSSDGAGPSAAAAPAAADTKTPVAPTNKRARPEEAPSVAQQATREEKPKVRKPRYSSAREAKNDRKNGVKQASIGAFFGS